VPASEPPGDQPAFFGGAVRADADGTVWLRTIPTRALAAKPL
jgi:hypothetical protein